MSDPQTDSDGNVADLIEQGTAALKNGDMPQAYTLLREAVRIEPNNERAWLWLAGAVASDEQRRFCLDRVLQINPQNMAARRGLMALPTTAAAPAPTPPAARVNTPYDPLAQSSIRPQPVVSPADSIRSRLNQAETPPTPPPTPSAATKPIERPSLAMLQSEQPPEPSEPPRQQRRSSFIRFGRGAQEKEKPANEQKQGMSLRPDIPITKAKRTIDRDTMVIIALVVVLIAIIALIAFLIMTQLDQRNRNAAALTAIPATAPIAANTATPVPSPTAVRTPTPRPEDLIARGRALVQGKDYKGAIVAYTQALAIAKLPDAYFERGQAYFELANYQPAKDDYTAAIELKPDFADAYHNRARTRARLNDSAGAIEDYGEALRLNPKDAISHLRRGITLRATGDLKGARTDFDMAIELKPDYIEAYYNRATLKQSQKDFPGALADFDESLKIKPDFALGLTGRGMVQIDLKRYQTSLEDCAKAITIVPDLVEAYYCHGRANAGLKKYSDALADFEQLFALNPDYPDGYRERARVYLAQGQRVKAKADYQTAIDLYKQIGNPDQATATQQELARLK
jgi:tetratricopeptide (TPR) repeat protein